jgi:hypothetical protein
MVYFHYTIKRNISEDSHLRARRRESLKYHFLSFFSIIIIISGSTVLERTLAASHWMFRNLIKTHGRTPLGE